LLLFWPEVDWVWNSGKPTGEEEGPERERGKRERENKTIKKIYLKKMKSRIDIIVGVFLRKLIIKVEIDTF
jgi:hypothetical protein